VGVNGYKLNFSSVCHFLAFNSSRITFLNAINRWKIKVKCMETGYIVSDVHTSQTM